ncbi:MAG TPA: hypothetical protein VF771_06020 [Longimicrobiaceae bacterium]
MTSSNEDFSASVRAHFRYLVEDLGFALGEDEWRQSSASYVVGYVSGTRYVRLLWGRKDAQFYFSVHRSEGGGVPPRESPVNEWFYIFELMHHLVPDRGWVWDLDIGASDPTPGQLDEKVRLNAEVLRRYGWEILQGKRWYDSEAKAMVGGA